MDDFDEFFLEYVYVVVASGFKAAFAARVTPLLVACHGDVASMRQHFKNKAKTQVCSPGVEEVMCACALIG